MDRMPEPPSPKQLEVLRHLYHFRHKHGYAPTLDELGRMMGVSKTTVHQYIRALEGKGLIRRFRNYARSLQIIDDELIRDLVRKEPTSWKLVGRLNAGNGKLIFYATPKKFEPELLVHRYAHASLLRVMGTPDLETGVRQGDYLLIEPFGGKHKKQLAIVQMTEGRTELHEIVPEDGRFVIHSKASSNPIRIHQADILAVVVGLLRDY